MKATIAIPEIKAMMVFAAVEDKRVHIKGVRVEVTEEQTLLIATNGHVLGVLQAARDEDVEHEVGTVVVPLDAVKALKTERLLRWVTISTGKDPDAVTLHDHNGDTTVVLPEGHDAPFEWRRVMPLNVSGEPAPGFDSEYLGRFAAFAKAIKHKGYRAMVRVFENGGSPALVKIYAWPEFVGVLMPGNERLLQIEPGLPDWLTGKKPADDVSDLA